MADGDRDSARRPARAGVRGKLAGAAATGGRAAGKAGAKANPKVDPTAAAKTAAKRTAAGAKAALAAPAASPPPRRRAVANAAAAAIGGAFRPWTAQEVETAFSRFEAANPHPEGELEYHDPYTLLVAVVLSAQATDTGVNKATRGLFKAAPTPAKMVALGEEGVAQHIRTLGLYRGKAKNVVELSRRLIAEHGGEVPADREALEKLPGVGRKTANVVLNIAFHMPTIAVDTHLFRVANRTGLAPGKTPLEVELGLERVIPERFKLHAHHWLILHGRYICKAIRPDCPRCLIADLCRWPEKTPA
ncbi:Endonuclease III [Starkeya nomas]|uniref:Endonuclease III n=1 Tax=Starkeya nomas TaxID=2666134 RepID=A0A5S9N9D4_9HYPH|nr:Endonuclease III [Starkeya nomas]